jgi:hypothetical protein
MKRYPKLIAGLIFVSVALLTFVAGVAASAEVGKLTGSGMLGICGPYGPDAGLVALIFFASFPVSPAIGLLSAWLFYRHFRGTHK